MEQELNTIIAPEVEDMPDFGEENTETDTEVKETAETPQDGPEKADTEDKPDDKSYYQFNPLQIALRPFLDQAKEEDPLFALEVMEKESRAEKPKSFAECCEYILGEAYHYASSHRNGNFGLAGMPDADVAGLIKHYYDEDDIVIRKMTGAKAKVVKTATPAKAEKKAKETTRQVNNTHDLAKVISANVKADTGKKREKKKDNLKAGFVPMERPDTIKDAKKGSREQAKSVEQLDMFADFFSE